MNFVMGTTGGDRTALKALAESEKFTLSLLQIWGNKS